MTHRLICVCLIALTVGRLNAADDGQKVRSASRDRVAAASQRRAWSLRMGSMPQSSDAARQGAVIDESRLERRTQPTSCVGSNTQELNNVALQVNEVAVASIGSCTIRIRNSHIVGDIAIKLSGSPTVSIENSIIEGRVALQLEGSPTVTVRSSTVRGAVEKVGSVTLRDLGGNLWQ